MPTFPPTVHRGPLYRPGYLNHGLTRPEALSSIVHPTVPNENGVYFPFQDVDWVELGLSPWGSHWGMQEGTGSAVGSGSAAFTLAPKGSPLYRQPVDGWTRVGIGSTGATNQGMTAASGTGPDITQSAVAWLVYLKLDTPAATRITFGNLNSGLTAQFAFLELTSGIPQLFAGGGTANGSTAHNDGLVHPFLLVAQSGVSAALYTDLNKMSRTISAISEGPKGFNPHTNAGTATCVYAAICSGSVAAALLVSGTANSFLSSLGWSPSWS